MFKWLQSYLLLSSLKVHFVRALWLGLILRLASAWFVYGPQALDDYKHGVYPAYQWAARLPLELPEYRSPLLVWLLGSVTRLAGVFGFDSALAQVRAMYIALALISLLAIVGTYYFAQSQRSRLTGALQMYLVAVFPLFPFIGTRAFGESVALAFVALGVGLLERARRSKSDDLRMWWLGFFSLGVATLFRFHVGIVFVVYGLILVFKGRWLGVVGGFWGGLTTLAAQVLVDGLSGRAPLGTLFAYLEANEGGAAQYGVSPWYNTWAFALAILLVPFSLVLVRGLPTLWRRQWPVLVSWLVFVFAHSLVPHKEERFLYPTVGLEMWALGLLWVQSARRPWTRSFFQPVVMAVTVIGLFVVCFVNTQEGEIEPPAYIQSHYPNASFLDYQSLFGVSRIQFYFLRPPSVLKNVGKEQFNAHRVDAELVEAPDRQAVALLTSDPESRAQLLALEGVKTLYGHCLNVRAAGSLIDRLLYSLNPKHNQRRRPTWYLICERNKVEH